MLIEQQILDFIHGLNNDFFDLIAVICHFLNDKGMITILTCIVLVIIPKTRKLGIYSFIAVIITAISTEILKELVSRERPFSVMEINSVVNMFNTDIAIDENAHKSFPSGHVSSIAALSMSVFLASKKKNYLIFIFPLIMMWSRMYLYVHFPTDVLAGLILGFVISIIAYKYLYKKYFV